ncbi:TerB family tellurite resistance protein [bacterium SCSIO 12741]|nr:TerB family tellurite resistance protein [bacterium SCSIO 12741]
MSNFGKFIGLGLGWAFMGPIGGIIGLALGHLVDRETFDFDKLQRQPTGDTRPGDFNFSLLVITAAVMKADGTIKKSELDFVRRFLINQFGENKAQEMLLALREILKQDIPLEEVCYQISQNMSPELRLQLLQYLFGVARADKHVHKMELATIERVAQLLRINQSDFNSIKAMYYTDSTNWYQVLNLSSDATESEIKKAYRKLATKYHPDKVAQLGEDYQKAAKEKFQKIQEAYENIKRERNFK